MQNWARAAPTACRLNVRFSNDLWSAVITQYVKALRIRRLCLEAGALFAGRMPMMSNAVAGGTTNTFHDRADFDAKLVAFRSMMEEIGTFVVREYIPLTIALGALYPDFDNVHNTGLTRTTAPTRGKGYGAGLGNFLAWGGFPQADDTMGLHGGVVVDEPASCLYTHRSRPARGGPSWQPRLREGLRSRPTSRRSSRARATRTPYGYEPQASIPPYPGSVTMTEPKRTHEDDQVLLDEGAALGHQRHGGRTLRAYGHQRTTTR